METNSPHKDTSQEDSIDVIALLSTLWQSRKFIAKTVIIFFIIGVMVALISPVKYSASTVFVPQIGSEVKASGGLSSLASLAGISLNSASQGAGDINPLLYPNLASNIPFKLALLSESIATSADTTLTIQSHLLSQSGGINVLGTLKKYTGLSDLLFSKDNKENKGNSDLIILSEDQKDFVKTLSEKYTVSVNEKEGYVSVSANDKDPVAAADFVRIVTANLQDQIIQKRLEKVQNNLDFAQNQYNQKKLEFEQIQDRLARFKDRNQNISNALFLNELERIQAEYSIALNVVKELASQVESAKLQVNKDTPIFSVINPVTVPTERESPKRMLIVLIWLFLGLVLAAGYILIKEPSIKIYNEIVS